MLCLKENRTHSVENKNSFGRKSTNVHPTETYITTSKGEAVVEIPANSLNIFRLK